MKYDYDIHPKWRQYASRLQNDPEATLFVVVSGTMFEVAYVSNPRGPLCFNLSVITTAIDLFLRFECSNQCKELLY